MREESSSRQIPDRESFESALAAPAFLLFKHSPVCAASAHARGEYLAFVESGEAVPTGWIDVVGQRELSRWIAEVSGVPHQSPQAILFREGKAVWNASHFDITKDALKRAVGAA